MRAAALVVLVGLVRQAAAQSACDPHEVEELRAHLVDESHRASRWNLTWGILFSTAAVGSAVVGYINPLPDLQDAMYVSAGKATIGALGRWVVPLRIDVPDATGDTCADLALLRRALRTAAKRERGNFYLNHLGGILVNGAGAAILWSRRSMSDGLLSVATGYPVGLLSNYMAPRNSWHRYRERDWSIAIVPRHDAWLVTIGGEL